MVLLGQVYGRRPGDGYGCSGGDLLQTAAVAESSQRVRVLVVDDNDRFRALLRLLLEESGHFEIVAEAADGLEGIRRAVQLQPDVITMDIQMPNMDGIAATRAIVQTLGIPVVVLSASEGAAGALAAGALAAISKSGADLFVPALVAAADSSTSR
jgi:CheY-like chemotaxis protein